MAGNLEGLRKLFVTGLGALLMSEEGILKMLADLKLPRDAKNYVISAAQKRKEDLTRVISSEVKDFLRRINIHEELRKAFDGLTIDVSATMHIKKTHPNVKITRRKTTRRTKRR